MSANARLSTFGTGAAVVLVAVVGGLCAVAACNDGEGSTTTVVTTYADGAALGDDALGDDDTSTPYTGPTQGGTVVTPSVDGSLIASPVVQDGASDTVDTACCNITFVYDPSHFVVAAPDAGSAAGDAGDSGDAGDAAVAVAVDAAAPVPTAVSLIGDAYPLENGAMLPMTKGTNGNWTVTACIPHDEYLRYRFFVGSTPNDPTNADAGSTPIDLCDPTLPSVSDGFGSCYDTFGPVDTCSEADASTGSLLNDP